MAREHIAFKVSTGEILHDDLPLRQEGDLTRLRNSHTANSFTLPVNDPRTPEDYQEILEPIASGVLVVDSDLDEPLLATYVTGIPEETPGLVSISTVTMEGLLASGAYVPDLRFDNADVVSVIARRLIESTGMRLVLDLPASGTVRTKYYEAKNYQTVWDALMELNLVCAIYPRWKNEQKDSFELVFQARTASHGKDAQPEHFFELGLTGGNIVGQPIFERLQNGEEYATRIKVIGSGEGIESLWVVDQAAEARIGFSRAKIIDNAELTNVDDCNFYAQYIKEDWFTPRDQIRLIVESNEATSFNDVHRMEGNFGVDINLPSRQYNETVQIGGWTVGTDCKIFRPVVVKIPRDSIRFPTRIGAGDYTDPVVDNALADLGKNFRSLSNSFDSAFGDGGFGGGGGNRGAVVTGIIDDNFVTVKYLHGGGDELTARNDTGQELILRREVRVQKDEDNDSNVPSIITQTHRFTYDDLPRTGLEAFYFDFNNLYGYGKDSILLANPLTGIGKVVDSKGNEVAGGRTGDPWAMRGNRYMMINGPQWVGSFPTPESQWAEFSYPQTEDSDWPTVFTDAGFPIVASSDRYPITGLQKFTAFIGPQGDSSGLEPPVLPVGTETIEITVQAWRLFVITERRGNAEDGFYYRERSRWVPDGTEKIEHPITLTYDRDADIWPASQRSLTVRAWGNSDHIFFQLAHFAGDSWDLVPTLYHWDLRSGDATPVDSDFANYVSLGAPLRSFTYPGVTPEGEVYYASGNAFFRRLLGSPSPEVFEVDTIRTGYSQGVQGVLKSPNQENIYMLTVEGRETAEPPPGAYQRTYAALIRYDAAARSTQVVAIEEGQRGALAFGPIQLPDTTYMANIATSTNGGRLIRQNW